MLIKHLDQGYPTLGCGPVHVVACWELGRTAGGELWVSKASLPLLPELCLLPAASCLPPQAHGKIVPGARKAGDC